MNSSECFALNSDPLPHLGIPATLDPWFMLVSWKSAMVEWTYFCPMPLLCLLHVHALREYDITHGPQGSCKKEADSFKA